MKKNGFTLVEIIVSVGLIAVVMLFLFQILIDLQYQEEHASFAKENQVNRASIIRTIQNDLMSNTLINVYRAINSDGAELDFEFPDFTRTLRVQNDQISYFDESWQLVKNNDATHFDYNNITIDYSDASCNYRLNLDANGDGVCDYNCDENQNGILDEDEMASLNEAYRSCPAYKYIKVIIPVVSSDKENAIDDIELFYIGKSE